MLLTGRGDKGCETSRLSYFPERTLTDGVHQGSNPRLSCCVAYFNQLGQSVSEYTPENKLITKFRLSFINVLGNRHGIKRTKINRMEGYLYNTEV